MWTDDLLTLGYLPAGDPRALTRFQRHARRAYRMTAAGVSLLETPVYNGPVDGVPGPAALDEIARWVGRGYRLPLGYFKMAGVGSDIGTWGRLRADAAAAWNALIASIRQIGGTIDGPYGDTKRPIMTTISAGASKYSFHICGRAVDLNQGNSAYFVAREPQAAETWWRIYCKTDDQSGARGQRFAGVTIHNFYTGLETALPDGYYLDLTAEIERGGLFERIRAQDGWERDERQCEWWHFQWVPDKQATFQDECELAGIPEAPLRAAGYSNADLDHTPG
jgi:hypothetical protein